MYREVFDMLNKFKKINWSEGSSEVLPVLPFVIILAFIAIVIVVKGFNL